MTLIIEFYTDGACLGNPGPGGWGYICLAYKNGIEIESSSRYGGIDGETTNNRAELTASIKALESLNEICIEKELISNKKITVFTDSSYLCDGIKDYLAKWRINGYRTSNNKPVKNQDLWEKLDRLVTTYKVEFMWVKGHSDNAFNNEADKLARKGALESAAHYLKNHERGLIKWL